MRRIGRSACGSGGLYWIRQTQPAPATPVMVEVERRLVSPTMTDQQDIIRNGPRRSTSRDRFTPAAFWEGFPATRSTQVDV